MVFCRSVNMHYEFYIQPFHALMVWIAKNILHLSYPVTVFTNGSGDTTYDYVVIFFITVISLFAAIIWSLLIKKQKHIISYFTGSVLFLDIMLPLQCLATGL